VHTAHSEDRASIGSATERRRTSDEEVKKSRRNGKRLLVLVSGCGPHESLLFGIRVQENKLTGTAELRIPYLFASRSRMTAGDPALRRSFCRHPTRANRDIRNTTTLGLGNRCPTSLSAKALPMDSCITSARSSNTRITDLCVVRNHDVSKPLRWKA
jgi:hypothetical protein